MPQTVLADRLHRRVQLRQPRQPRLQRLVVLLRPVDDRGGHPPRQRPRPRPRPAPAGRGLVGGVAPGGGGGGARGPVLGGVRRLEVGAGVDPGVGGDCVGIWVGTCPSVGQIPLETK